MLHSREFIAGLAAMGIAQFLWTLARLFLLGPSEGAVAEWSLGTVPGVFLAATIVTVLTAIATAIRAETSSRAAFFRILAGTYIGMFVSLVVIAPSTKWVAGTLWGLGILLPPLALGSVAGEVIRKLRRPRSSTPS